MTSYLSDQKTAACTPNCARLSQQEAESLRAQIPNWELQPVEGGHLQREYLFTDFQQALDFTNKLAALAEENEHHPSITTRQKAVQVQWHTEMINGLHLNDFIMAAKTDRLYADWGIPENEKDIVQLASEQSFPASDPPGYTGRHAEVDEDGNAINPVYAEDGAQGR